MKIKEVCKTMAVGVYFVEIMDQRFVRLDYEQTE